jgi:DNA modification methylase
VGAMANRRTAAETIPTSAQLARAAWLGSGAKPWASDDVNGRFWKLFQGDSAEVLRSLPDESVNCVVTSPAYYWQRDYDVDGQYGKEATPEEFVQNLRNVFSELKRILRKDGTVFLNLGDTYYSAKGRPHGHDPKHRSRRLPELRAVDGPGLSLPRKSLIGIPWRVALALQEDGWTLRSDIIWARQSAIPEPTAKDRPWRSFEHVFLLSRSARYSFQRDALEDEEDIWYIEPERNGASRGVHYAPYPRELVRRCVECGCPDGGVVLDPFAGGGTTLYESLAIGRSVVGIELSPAFCSLVTTKLSEATSGKLLDFASRRISTPPNASSGTH